MSDKNEEQWEGERGETGRQERQLTKMNTRETCAARGGDRGRNQCAKRKNKKTPAKPEKKMLSVSAM